MLKHRNHSPHVLAAVVLSIVGLSLAVKSESAVRRRAVHTPNFDADGVAMLYASASGSSYRLGALDPNTAAGFGIESLSASNKIAATAQNDGAFHYWTVPSYELSYSSGDKGSTSRLNMYASAGNQQLYTWQDGRGYLFNSSDVKNQEVTAFIRIRGVIDPPHLSITLKIRGGRHTGTHDPRASCTMMTFEPGGTLPTTRFRKELNHPDYDSTDSLPTRFPARLQEGRWYGLKLVSYTPGNDSSRVVNELYLDTDPIDFQTGRVRNNWKLFSDYTDVRGVALKNRDPNGGYTTLADWGGWVTTVRVDGVQNVDFALLSVREIAPRPF